MKNEDKKKILIHILLTFVYSTFDLFVLIFLSFFYYFFLKVNIMIPGSYAAEEFGEKRTKISKQANQ